MQLYILFKKKSGEKSGEKKTMDWFILQHIIK